MSPERYPSVEMSDVDALTLELIDSYLLDRLVVFIQDPQNPNLFWHRRIGEFKSQRISRVKGRGIGSYQIYDIEPYDSTPLTLEMLPQVVQNVIVAEDQASDHPDPRVREARASVAIAKYGGSNALSLEGILDLVAFRYVRMRASIRN